MDDYSNRLNAILHEKVYGAHYVMRREYVSNSAVIAASVLPNWEMEESRSERTG